ncbi:Gfo/Idh/MocA family protein [Domibacillus indicus]|uniref:Gfo/Idh/MocA family protein n=1 Tax=Domibacillus indicus TaxID=1437523 RepID=UPI000ADDE6A6|nr:Gfo/Idh/MocA family oxidoreductase [Domibacillus indicus]
MKVGMIGTGGFSRMHAEILADMEEVKLQAVCGTSRAKAEAFASEYGGANGYDQLVEMLDSEKLDAVYICVPPFAHGEIERQLIERGIPFFVEKPLAADLEVPGEIMKALQKKKLITSVGYHFRYRNTVAALKKELEAHTIGMATGSWMGSMPLVSWWRNRDASGGQFVEQTTHLIDLIRYTLGEVEEVYAVEADRLMAKQHEHVTAPDVGSAVLKMKSGVIVQLSNTCMLPAGVSQIELQFFHSGGITKMDQSGLTKCTPAMEIKEKDSVNPYIRENDAFLHAVRTGDASKILSSYEDAWRTQEVTSAISKSAASKKTVQLGGK